MACSFQKFEFSFLFLYTILKVTNFFGLYDVIHVRTLRHNDVSCWLKLKPQGQE